MPVLVFRSPNRAWSSLRKGGGLPRAAVALLVSYNPVFTYRSEVERRVVPHLSRPGGVLMRRRLAAVGRAWRRGVSLPWRRAVARGGRRAARGKRRPEAVPQSGVLGLDGGARSNWCGETLRARADGEGGRGREVGCATDEWMESLSRTAGLMGLLLQPKSAHKVSAEQPCVKVSDVLTPCAQLRCPYPRLLLLSAAPHSLP